MLKLTLGDQCWPGVHTGGWIKRLEDIYKRKEGLRGKSKNLEERNGRNSEALERQKSCLCDGVMSPLFLIILSESRVTSGIQYLLRK